jgi:mono/diheme cytochrome c family protein
VEDSMQYMSDDDLNAIAFYLKSLPPRKASGAYVPQSLAARQTSTATRTGNVERPGAGIYLSYCAKCHGAEGQGEPQKYPKLAGNPSVLTADTTSLIRLMVEGGNSPGTKRGPPRQNMPAYADTLTNMEMAHVLTFIRTTWGNNASPVTTRDVIQLRAGIHK